MCTEKDLNLHALFGLWFLRPARLPVPPSVHGAPGMYRPYVLGVSIPCSTIELLKHGGCGKIRTYEEINRLVYSQVPLTNSATHPTPLLDFDVTIGFCWHGRIRTSI